MCEVLMPDKIKNTNYKLKIIYVYKILYENTDEEHRITMPEIISMLRRYGIDAGRKGIYDDIEALKDFGVDIVSGRGGGSSYYIASREFQLPELKLLADEVSSSKFLTEKKSRELVKKLGKLCSKNDAKQMQRQIYVADRVKTTNERIYLNVDILNKAIGEKKKISFRYFDYDIRGNKKYREGTRECSPYGLTYSNEQYYLISRYDKRPDVLTNFRVDRMDSIKLSSDPYEPAPQDFNMSEYLKRTFSMFSGHTGEVKLRLDRSLVNAVIDRFGKNITMQASEDDKFTIWTSVNVEQPRPFFSWLFLLGDDAEILEPAELREQYIEMLEKVLQKQKNDKVTSDTEVKDG